MSALFPRGRFVRAVLFLTVALAAGRADVLAAGSADAARQKASFYTLIPIDAPEYAFALSMVSDTSVWYTTSRGLYRSNGSQSEKLLDASRFAGSLIEVFLAEALSDRDVWVLGHDASNWRKSMYHYDGKAWRGVPFPRSDDDPSSERLVFRFRMAADGAGHYGMAVGDGGLYYVFDRGAWMQRPAFTPSRLRTLALLSRTDAWAGGKGDTLFHFDGEKWSAVHTEGGAPDQTFLELSFSSPDSGWAVSSNAVFRWAGGRWTRSAIPAGLSPRTVAAAAGDDAWIFADNGTVLRWDGSSWSVAAKVPMQAGYASAGIIRNGAGGGDRLAVVTTAGIMSNTWGRIPAFVDVSPAVNLHLDGGEAAIADFDGNGTDDLFVAANGTYPDRLYSNRGDAFFTETTARLHPPGRPIASRPEVADLDNNGFPDIVAYRGMSDNLWYRNRAEWSFEEVPGPVAAWGASNYGRLKAADIDLDGDLDLVQMPASEERRDVSLVVRLNDGAGRFPDSVTLGAKLRGGTAQLGFTVADLTGDLLPDVFKYNVGDRAEFWLNEGGGRFRECAAERGLDWLSIDPAPYLTWAGGIDVNRDGAMDLFVVSRAGLGLFLVNDGNSGFVRGDSVKYDARGENPAAAFADIDCDGDEDLFLLDRFYENREGTFTEHRYPGLRRIGNPAFADLDGDGDKDVILRTMKDARGLAVFENGIDAGNVLTVVVRGTRSNSHAIGATVKLWRRPAAAGGGHPGGGGRASVGAATAEDSGWVFDRLVAIDGPSAVRCALDTSFRWRLEVGYPSGIVVRKDDVRPGRMRIDEFGVLEGAWWDFWYSFRRTLVLADPAAEGAKLAIMAAGIAAALILAVKRLLLPRRPAVFFGLAALAGYVLAVHGTIRQSSAAAMLIPMGGATAATAAWIAAGNAVERRRRERRISHYLLEEKLGEGGMGKVFAATDSLSGERVALKVLNQGLLADPENRKRLMAEGHLLSSINHPRIVKVYEVGEHLGQGFIAMEYLPGGTLEALCRAKGPLGTAEVKRIALGICDGLREIHGRGVIHRDLKSGNVMFDSGGEVRIMDFGLSKSPLVTTMTTLGTILGTLGYVSPEQVTNISVDQRADLFSFGVLLYEMLTGKLPFDGENEMAVIHAIFNVEPPPPSALNPSVGARLDAVVRRCLRKNPDERHASANDLYFDLDGDYW